MLSQCYENLCKITEILENDYLKFTYENICKTANFSITYSKSCVNGNFSWKKMLLIVNF